MTRFSRMVTNLRSSEIRDLMSLATKPDIISFAGGMPGNELFPIDEINSIYNSLSIAEKQVAMQYGPTSGLPVLLESLSAYLEKKGLPVAQNKLMITTGSLQAINILAKTFIDPGDTILVENPSFIGAISAFKSYQANMVMIPLTHDGMSIDILKQKLIETDFKPKFLYYSPHFHNPAGTLYSVETKKQIIQILQRKDIPILEDDVYDELYFFSEDTEKLIPIKTMNPEGIDVCYTGSFSKILGPGFRLGWMLVPPHIYQKCELIKQSFDACSPSFTQVIADKFIRNGYLYQYVSKVRDEYKKRATTMINTLKEYLPGYVKWIEPRGGFYIWLELPDGTDSTEVLKKAIEKGAVFVSGKTFDPEGIKNNTMR
ncbi:MAG: PLP-dependent aminotransferase family protein, partial [Bacteroidales bacterium]|nr:PLP-dependent aminotransferase family protein [Bacteroidales bacterium]